MLMHKLVVSSSVGGLNEVLDESRANMFKTGDVEAMKSAILKAYNSTEESVQSKIDTGYQYAINHFSQKRMCTFLNDGYKSLNLAK